MPQSRQGAALRVVNWIADRAVGGIPPLSSAENLAQEYLIDASYPDDEERIESLINWETTKNFTTGFVTGLGGLITMPLTVPASFGASWIVQARMAAAIARIAGHDLKSDRIRTFVVVCLLGDAATSKLLKPAGIKLGAKMASAALNKVPGKVLIEINKQIGFRLLTKAGQTGVVNLSKAIPFVGGAVGGAIDAASCRVVGKTAKRLFFPRAST